MDIKVNDEVKVKTFLGTRKPREDIVEAENYWKLIGKKGKVLSVRKEGHPAFPEKGE